MRNLLKLWIFLLTLGIWPVATVVFVVTVAWSSPGQRGLATLVIAGRHGHRHVGRSPGIGRGRGPLAGILGRSLAVSCVAGLGPLRRVMSRP